MMRRTDNREALDVYAQIKSILDASGSNRLAIEPRLTLARDGNVTSAVWRPYGFSETALCVVDGGDGSPCVVTWRPSGAFKKIIQRCAGALHDGELAEAI